MFGNSDISNTWERGGEIADHPSTDNFNNNRCRRRQRSIDRTVEPRFPFPHVLDYGWMHLRFIKHAWLGGKSVFSLPPLK